MNCLGPFIFPFFFCYPHFPESIERGENRAANPGGIQALLRCGDTNFDVLRGQLFHLPKQSVAEALEECRSSTQNDVVVETLAEVQVGPLDAKDETLVNSLPFFSYQIRSEQNFGRSISTWPYFDDRPVGQHMRSLNDYRNIG